MTNKKHIAFCISDNYVEYICVTILSIVHTNPNSSFIIHILSDSISEKSRKILNDNFRDYQNNLKIELHIIDDSSLSNLKTGRWTKYGWYRLLIPNILTDVEKILYLDADTVVNGNIEAFFDTNIEDKSIIGTLDTSNYEKETYLRSDYDSKFGYVCSGILLMNLDYWREHQLTEKIIDWSLNNKDKIEYPDQDSINHICFDSKLIFPVKYGFMHYALPNDDFYKLKYNEMEEAIHSPIIVHYASNAPWKAECDNPHLKIWRKFNRRLNHPSPITYKTKGINSLKVKIWNLFNDRSKSKREWMLSKLSLYKNQ